MRTSAFGEGRLEGRGIEQDAVEGQVGGACSLMELDVAAPAVIGGKVEDEVHAIDRFAGSVLIQEVTADELDAGAGQCPDV